MTEFCPNCGGWVDDLHAATGWCRGCSLSQKPEAVAKRDWRARNRDADREYQRAYKAEWRRRRGEATA